MKKIILAAVAVFGISFASNAQDIGYGVKAGANFSSLNFEVTGGTASPDGATSLYVGGFVDVGVSEKFHVQPELLYSIEGAEDVSLSFLNIPIMAKYYVADGLSLQAGPQIGFLVSAEDDADEVLKSTNLGLNAGLGYELKDMGLFFDARYNFGLTDISDVDGTEVRTKGFQIGIGYKF